MVVATVARQVLVYDVSGSQPREHSPLLKYQTRCASCFADQSGYAIGSIEGRAGIQYVQMPAGRKVTGEDEIKPKSKKR